MVEESDAEGDVDPDSPSSSSHVELVENLVAIPVPAPSDIHMLVPVDTPRSSFLHLFMVCLLLHTLRIGMRIWYMMECWSTG